MSNSISLDEAIARHGVDVLTHLDREASIPMVSRIGRQGDVLVLSRKLDSQRGAAVPASGVPVVRGENGGNTHLLLAEGPVFFAARDASAGNLLLGTLVVPAGSTAYLAHPEHGYLGIEPGSYVIRRQREQADELRMVAD